MRALWLRTLGGPEALRIEEVPDPVPGKGELLVAMRAAAVNFPDLLTTEGKYQLRPELPFAPGKEGAGVVAAVGDGVTQFHIGDRVMVQADYGTFAERAVAREHELVRPERRQSSFEFGRIDLIGSRKNLSLVYCAFNGRTRLCGDLIE